MKKHVLFISRKFPAYHKRAGEDTGFVEKILAVIDSEMCYYPLYCRSCNYFFTDNLCIKKYNCPKCDNKYAITDTLQFNYYGDLTNFENLNIKNNYIEDKLTKIHTIRKGYDNWKRKIDEVNDGKAVLSLRYWSGRPYRSKPVEFLILDKNSGIGVEYYEIRNPMPFVDTCVKAENDGLSEEDFMEWFKNADWSIPHAIIHFTKFRYGGDAM